MCKFINRVFIIKIFFKKFFIVPTVFTNRNSVFFKNFTIIFNVVFINTPINYDCSNFYDLQLPKKVIPTGFVFIWADKENIPLIINIFEDKNFFYVENLVWVQEHEEDAKNMQEV